MNSKPKTLPQESWDFSRCKTEELSFCFAYEYFRQLALTHRYRIGAAWSASAFAALFDGYYQDGVRTEFNSADEGHVADPFEINLSVKRTFAKAVCLCPGFPDVPYLSLNAEERNAWIREFGLDKLRPDRPAMAQADFFEILLGPREAVEQFEHHCKVWAILNLQNGSEKARTASRWIVNYDGFPFELGVIRLNWSSSNKKLIEAFKKWLEQHRPSDASAFETRGSTSLSEALKYLSASRLLAVMSVSEAFKLTQKTLPHPLYWDEANWYDARKKADAVMKQLSSPFFDWAIPPKPDAV